jgi:hypothetical protein
MILEIFCFPPPMIFLFKPPVMKDISSLLTIVMQQINSILPTQGKWSHDKELEMVEIFKWLNLRLPGQA